MPLGMYGPSKYGLRALGTELRHEIIAAKLNIKITVRVHYYICCCWSVRKDRGIKSCEGVGLFNATNIL
jgi:hypothetical protein